MNHDCSDDVLDSPTIPQLIIRPPTQRARERANDELAISVIRNMLSLTRTAVRSLRTSAVYINSIPLQPAVKEAPKFSEMRNLKFKPAAGPEPPPVKMLKKPLNLWSGNRNNLMQGARHKFPVFDNRIACFD